MSDSKQVETPVVVGFYDSPSAVLEGMKKVKAAGFSNIDAYTPFPVHGMDEAQGLKRSFLPWVTFFGGLTGLSIGLGFQYWTSAVDWPLIVGGKPFFSWPAFVPVTFELTVLLAGLSTVGAMFAINGLPNIKKKALDARITRDRFAIAIEMESPKAKGTFKKFSVAEATDVLKQAGAKDIKSVLNEGWF
jgi:hypothetical protein